MDKEDGRKLTRQAQYERYKQAVRMFRHGMPIQKIAITPDMAGNTVRGAISCAEQEGVRTLAPKPSRRASLSAGTC